MIIAWRNISIAEKHYWTTSIRRNILVKILKHQWTFDFGFSFASIFFLWTQLNVSLLGSLTLFTCKSLTWYHFFEYFVKWTSEYKVPLSAVWIWVSLWRREVGLSLAREWSRNATCSCEIFTQHFSVRNTIAISHSHT